MEGYQGSQGAAFVRALSPEARRRILEILLERRSYRELAAQLNVSPAAIVKYRSGRATPSDEVIARALAAMDYDEAEDIAFIITEEVAEVVEDFIDWIIRLGAPAGRAALTLERAAARLRLEGSRGRVRII